MKLNNSPSLHILIMPDFRYPNPYQSLLAAALEKQGVTVDFWRYPYVKTFPIFRAAVIPAWKNPQNSYQVVHLHWIHEYIESSSQLKQLWRSLKFILDIICTRLAGVKIVWTVHNAMAHESKFPRLERWTRSWVAQWVDRLIFHSQSTLDSVAQLYGFAPTKATAIPIGHYRDVYHPLIDSIQARAELGLPGTGRIYLHFGLLRPYKGIEKLIQAWQNWNRDDSLLVIAGKPQDEAYKNKLNQQVEGISTIRLYPEYIDNSKLHLFFSAANIVVLPFDKILNSSSLILAMSYAKPIIAPRLGGIPETMKDADTLLYDPEDEQGLIKALEKSKHVNLDELSESVIKVCDQLDWNGIGKKTLAVYQMAMNLRH